MRKKLFLVGLSLVLTLILSTGCGGSKGQQQGAPQSSSKEPIKIGLALPMTGVAALYGEQASKGAELAKEQINASGGILGGRQIEIILEDDKASPEEGVNVVQKLINRDKVQVVAGGVNSSVTLAEIPITKAANKLHIVTISMAPSIVEQGHPYLFQLNTDNNVKGDFFYPWVAKKYPQIKKVAMLVENTDYGRAEVDTIKRNWKDPNGPQLSSIEWFQLGETNFTIQLTKIKAQNPDALIITVAAPATNGTILKQAKEIGFNKTILIAPGNLNKDVIKIAGDASEGILSADHYIPSLDNSENKTFVQAFEKKYGYTPEKMEVQGFETVYLVAQAMEKAKTADDPAKIAEALRTTTWKTPRGEVTFNEKGRVGGKMYPLIVKQGKIVQAD
ncbi:MAG: ABC transporter substrate-binding protein [Bacillota bacterium]